MAASLIVHERVRTTLPKAKELRRVAERMVTWGKEPAAAQYRVKATGFLRNKDAVAKLFNEIAPRYTYVAAERLSCS
jgi:large subunit ribosomal protein L17